jgi:hypothetical protein
MFVRAEAASYFAKPKRSGTYIRPFRILLERTRIIDRSGRSAMAVADEEFLSIIQSLLSSISVDEEWYRRRYPDAAIAIDAGLFSDAQDHFIANGYFEGRVPYEIAVDAKFYLSKYPDVESSIRLGLFDSAQDHFQRLGYQEGRLPERGQC